MRVQLLALLTLSLASSQKSKDSDEGRPYEFGFTIDGQQHRHEKKDENGIIQGEFGFITADGIYHVTVYATDENGNFKILSMKNVRVSAPLDGSPATGPISPDAGKYIGKQNPTVTTEPPRQFQKLQQSPITPKQKSVTAFQGFTTQPTVRPACAGCGYVTTAKPAPGQPFAPPNGAFPQGPSRQNGFGGESIDLVRPSDVELISQGVQSDSVAPSSRNPQSIGGSHDQSPQAPVNNPFGSQEANDQPLGNFPNAPDQIPSVQNSFGQPGGRVSQSPTQPGLPGTNGAAGLPVQSEKIQELPPISVDRNTIHVGGKRPQDIAIQDKYPGMVDGLPDGIEEKDITNILYKFKYIVGFHGHWEKGLKNGAKIGGYFVNGRDGISRVVNYVADENGYRPKFKFINLGLDSDETPKEGSEKKFGLKSFEFVWYPID